MQKVIKFLFQVYLALLISVPTELGVLLRYFAYKRLFKKTQGKFRIDTGVTIVGFENITLGTNVNIMKNSYLYAHDSGQLIIGNNFSMNTNVQLGAAGGHILIGNNCAIGPNCVLRAANHNFDTLDKPFNQQGHQFGEINLEDDVWIAANVVITANVRIGKSSVVAAGAVVTNDVKEMSVVGGVPAKLIKQRSK